MRGLKLPSPFGGEALALSSLDLQLGGHTGRDSGIAQRATGLSASRDHDLTNRNILIPLTSSGLPVNGILSNANFTAQTYDGNVYLTRNNIQDPEHNHANLQILRIQYDQLGRITHVTQNVNDSLLRCFFEELPDLPLVNTLKSALGVTAPEEQDRIAFRDLIGESQESVRLDQEIRARTQADSTSVLYEQNYSPEAVLSISQGEYGVVSSTQAKKIIGTHGAGPCVLVGISAIDGSGKYRVVGVTHIDGMTDGIATIRALLQDVKRKFSEHSIGGYVLSMKGGDLSSQEQVRAIYKALHSLEQSDPQCKGLDLCDVNPSGRSSLAIDTEQGESHRFVPDPSRAHAVASLGSMNFGTSKRVARPVH